MTCYYDSIDEQIFENNLEGIVEELITLIKSVELSNTPKESGTLNEFLIQLNEGKKTEEYKKVRQIVTAKNEIENKVAKLSNWKHDQQLLIQMNYSTDDIDAIKDIVAFSDSADFNWTYNKVFEEWIEFYESIYCQEASYSEILHMPHGLSAYYELSEAYQCSKKIDFPILMYFSGHGLVDCREFEANIMSDKEVLNILNEEYIISNLYVDDRTVALPHHQLLVNESRDTLKRIGEINQYIQKQMFNENVQPAFYIVDSLGKQISKPFHYNKSKALFKKFLKDGIKEYRKE